MAEKRTIERERVTTTEAERVKHEPSILDQMKGALLGKSSPKAEAPKSREEPPRLVSSDEAKATGVMAGEKVGVPPLVQSRHHEEQAREQSRLAEEARNRSEAESRRARALEHEAEAARQQVQPSQIQPLEQRAHKEQRDVA